MVTSMPFSGCVSYNWYMQHNKTINTAINQNRDVPVSLLTGTMKQEGCRLEGQALACCSEGSNGTSSQYWPSSLPPTVTWPEYNWCSSYSWYKYIGIQILHYYITREQLTKYPYSYAIEVKRIKRIKLIYFLQHDPNRPTFES